MRDVTTLLRGFRRLAPTVERPNELRVALESLITEYLPDDETTEMCRRLVRFLFSEEDHPIDLAMLSSRDRLYAEHILGMKKHITARRFIDDEIQIGSAGEEFDFVTEESSDWHLLKVINLALLLSIPARRRVAIVTSIRNEGLSILEWVAHHRAMGIDEIFVYTNNNTDRSTPLLEKLAQNRMIRLLGNTVGKEVAPQIKAYEHSISFLKELRQYRWVFYLDADEFFLPRCGSMYNMDELFSKIDVEFGPQPPAAMAFNWKWFGSQNARHRTDGLLLERFEYSIHNPHVKTLMQLNCVLSMRPCHCPILFEDCASVDSQGRVLAPLTKKTNPVYGLGQVNHYWNKSFQEFIMKKFRGRGAVPSSGSQREFSSFFEWGANGSRGNYDPPPPVVLNRTRSAYLELLAVPGIARDLEAINECFTSTISLIDKELNLENVYEKHGQV